jgi:hypothetical protein
LTLPDSTSRIVGQARRIRTAAEEPTVPDRVAQTLAAVFDKWRARDYPPRRETIARISARLGFSSALLDESIGALLSPFTSAALRELASLVVPSREVVGFVMAGNVAGPGMHEVGIALIAGCGLILKTATREPLFFDAFVRDLAEEAPAVAARIAVLNWERERRDLTDALRRETDLLVAYGDDATIASLGKAGAVLGFGSKVSGAVVTRGALRDQTDMATRLARDVVLFEQLGCLSPHHFFVESTGAGEAMRFAESMARAMNHLTDRLRPPRLELEDAAALRGVRENARWRSIAGEAVRLIEGPDLSWAVIFDRDATFTPSPGLRCVYITPVRDAADLRSRLAPARGRIEAFAVADRDGDGDQARTILREAGVSYLAAPGAMQSPPLTWRHGGGIFLDRMTTRR